MKWRLFLGLGGLEGLSKQTRQVVKSQSTGRLLKPPQQRENRSLTFMLFLKNIQTAAVGNNPARPDGIISPPN